MAGNEIIETQTYYTQPENDWEFDDTQKLSYNNPVFLEQCKRKGITVKDEGWVPQHKIGETPDKEDEVEEVDEVDEVEENDNDE